MARITTKTSRAAGQCGVSRLPCHDLDADDDGFNELDPVLVQYYWEHKIQVSWDRMDTVHCPMTQIQSEVKPSMPGVGAEDATIRNSHGQWNQPIGPTGPRVGVGFT